MLKDMVDCIDKNFNLFAANCQFAGMAPGAALKVLGK